MAAVVFAACLFGIHAPPLGFLANVGPANAIMLGVLLRRLAMASLPGWLAACIAFMAADLLTGATLVKALLNGANVVGIGVAYAICVRLSKAKLHLEHQASLLDIAPASAVGAAAAGIVGGLANPVLFGRGVVAGWTFWFATEFVNYVAILPVILSAPQIGAALPNWKQVRTPVPALLWCGHVYPVFPTALLTLRLGLWSLAIISATYLPGAQGPYDETALISVRLAASLIVLGPIMLAVVMQSRKELLSRLHHLATHDQLPERRADMLSMKTSGSLHMEIRPSRC